MLTVDVVPVIVSKLLSMKRPRRRRKVSAARRRSRNPVHDRSRQKCRLLTSPLSSIVFTSSCTVDSNSYTPQLIAKYATTNISGMASYRYLLRMRLLPPRRRSSSHVTTIISGMASYMRLHVTELASVNETRIPIRRSSSQSTRQRTIRAWRRTDTSCACGCCLGVAAHRTKNVTTNILGMASHMRLHVIHEEVDSIFPHVSGENPAGEFVLKTQY